MRSSSTVKRLLIVSSLLLNCHISFALPETNVTASDAAERDAFGTSASISGDYAIIGASGVDDYGNGSGAAYIFVRDGAGWTQQVKLTADDAAEDDEFGCSVSISGDYAIVGAVDDDDDGSGSGSAYIFVRNGETWTQQAKLTADDGSSFFHFGCSVSICDNYALIGATGSCCGDDYHTGAVYIFIRNDTTWTQQAKLTTDDAETGDNFGCEVCLKGDEAIIGAWGDDDAGENTGSAYIFVRDSTNWTQQAKLTADDGARLDYFGEAVSIDGDKAVVGAYFDDDGGENCGSAYIFVRDGVNWTQQAKLTSYDAEPTDAFGFTVFINDDCVFVSATGDDDCTGAVYVFAWDGTIWNCQMKLTASDGSVLDTYGKSVFYSGSDLIVGANADCDAGYFAGSAYIYQCSITHAIPRGEYVLIGVPVSVNDGDPNTLFGDDFNNCTPGAPNWSLSRWDVTNQKYTCYQETDIPDVGGDQDPPDFTPGLGFWLWQDVADNCELGIEISELADFVPQDEYFSVALDAPLSDPDRRGLTMVANPYYYVYNWSTTHFWDGTEDKTIAEAVASNWINGYAYTWDHVTEQYVPIRYDAVNAGIEKWNGFWIEQMDDSRELEVRFTPEGYGAAVLAGLDGNRGELDEEEWHLSLIVMSGDGENRDEYSGIGVSDACMDGYDGLDAMEFEPMSSDFVQVYFSHPEWPERAENFTYDYRSADFSGGAKTWYFTVRTWHLPGESLELTWPGIEAVNDTFELLLYTPDNTVIDLRSTDSYTFTSENEEDSRQNFMIVCRFASTDVASEDSGIPATYAIHELYPNPFNPHLNLVVALPQRSDLKINVFNILGEEVGEITNSHFGAGYQRFVFDASHLASGVYFVKAVVPGQMSETRKVLLVK